MCHSALNVVVTYQVKFKIADECEIYGMSPTYMNRLCDWLITTIKDNKTIEINFLKNESKTMITFVVVNQSPNAFILGT